MNFQNLKKVETVDTYLDIAFSRASRRADTARDKKTNDRISKSKFIETTRIQSVEGTLTSKFDEILQGFPDIDSLPEFYQRLVKITIDYPMLKKSLGAVRWAQGKIRDFTQIYSKKIARMNDPEKINTLRKEYYGRISSISRQVKKELVFLEDARRTMKGYPNIKTSMFTVAICGFPNIGKTTLLSKLTGSTPQISDYAFTTKRLNVGYLKEEKIQLIDTPGTLDRVEKMNDIEKMAYLAMTYVSHAYVYIFDLTEPYPLKDQEKLFRKLQKDEKPMIVYLSKTDIMADFKGFAERFKAVNDMGSLKKELIALRDRTPL